MKKQEAKTSINDLLRDCLSIINELSLSKNLIKFPSVSPIDAGAIGYASKTLRALGFRCKIIRIQNW